MNKSNLSKISPEYNMYDAYSVSDDDSTSSYNEPVLRPSHIITAEKDKNYDSDSSDDYNENNIIMNNKRKKSFIRNSLKSFKVRTSYLPSKIRDTFIINNKKNNCKKILVISSFISTIVLILTFSL